MNDQYQNEFLEDVQLASYSPSERRAILVHRYFLGIEWNCNPGIEAAIRSWEQHYASQWREKKMRNDRVAQMTRIEEFRMNLSRNRGYEIPWDEAANSWMQEHAARWRDEWEHSPQSDT